MSVHPHSANAGRQRALLIALTIGLSLLLTLICTRALGAWTGAVVSDFSHGTDGWTVRGPVMGPAWEPHEGRPPASIMAASTDPGREWYWHAPDRFLGNRSDVYGRTLRYDVRVSSVPESFDVNPEDDVILHGAGTTLVYHAPELAATGWMTRIVPLTEAAGWQKRSGPVRAPATRRDFQA